VLLAFIWLIGLRAFAQTAIKSLNIGDQVPDLEFSNLMNSQKKSIKLSDLKGKLVIIDFWATWCAPCMAALPKMDSLQKEFAGKLVVLPVTEEKKETLLAMFARVPEIQKLSLEYVYQTNLNPYFPHRQIPHEIWIDGSGKVIAVTDDKEVTRENIRKQLRGQSFNVREKKDVMNRDPNKLLLLGKYEGYPFKQEQVKYSSTIMSGISGTVTARAYKYKKIGNQLVVGNDNCLVIDLYRTALVNLLLPLPGERDAFNKSEEFYLLFANRALWEASNTKFRSTTKEDSEVRSKTPNSNEEFTFSYELVAPLTDTLDNKYKSYILQDLNRYFGSAYGFIGTKEKRRTKCYALTVIGPEELFKTKGGKSENNLIRGTKGFKIVNRTVNEWMFQWQSFVLPYFNLSIPIINETGYLGNMDLDLGPDIDPTDFKAVNSALKKSGLEFKLVERDLDMIVIKDIK